MSERMSTRRERKQTEQAEAATEEKAAAPPKEKVEKVERRQSAGACVDMWASVCYAHRPPACRACRGFRGPCGARTVRMPCAYQPRARRDVLPHHVPVVCQAGASASAGGDQGKAESKPAKEEKKESHKAGAHSAKQEPKEKEHKEPKPAVEKVRRRRPIPLPDPCL